jgi:hypothetical protein
MTRPRFPMRQVPPTASFESKPLGFWLFKALCFLDYFSLDFSTFVEFDIDCDRFTAADFSIGLKAFSFTHLSPPLDVKVQSGAYPSGRCRMRQDANNILLGGPSPKTQKLNKLFSSYVSKFDLVTTNKPVRGNGRECPCLKYL